MADAGEGTASEIMKRTIFVEGLRMSVEKLTQQMKTIFPAGEEKSSVVSLVRRRDGYEITFDSEEAALNCVDNGFNIDHRQYDAVSLCNQEILVTLYPVPAYVEDSAIKAKLNELSCQVMGEVKRSQINGIETGRRKVVVVLPPNTRSLPRALLVKAVNGKDERIEVFHRNQKARKNTR